MAYRSVITKEIRWEASAVRAGGWARAAKASPAGKLDRSRRGSPLPDLHVSVQGPSTIADSSSITYHLTVNNTGNANAVDITLINTIPDGTSVTSVTV